jgi:hypothetical protein
MRGGKRYLLDHYEMLIWAASGAAVLALFLAYMTHFVLHRLSKID